MGNYRNRTIKEDLKGAVLGNEPLFHRSDYSKAKSKKGLSKASGEELQALAKSSDDELDQAFSQFGMSSKVDYYPLTAMGNPFDVSFDIKTIETGIPVSWMGEKKTYDNKINEQSFKAKIWLSPESFKKIKSGNLEKDSYKFKIIKINKNDLKDNYLEFKAEEININDKITGEVSPRLILNKKYSILASVGDSDVVDLDGAEDEEQKDIPVPEEITSGKNRNEIFRLLLKQFGGYKGKVVYGDGFSSPEQAREYSKLQRAVKTGKVDKSKLKEFREQANRDGYSMMISNLRKSYPTTFMSKLSKAFPEFNIKYTKESVDESLSLFPLLEEDNPDKYKRWSLVFSNKVIGGKNIDSLDKNIREFMATVKKWFAVPVTGPDGKKRSYNISYDEDKVNSYWNKFYGKSKKESKLNLYNVLSEMINEKDRSNVLEDVKSAITTKIKSELIFKAISVKGMRSGERRDDLEFDVDSVVSGKDSVTIKDYKIDQKYINEISEGAKKSNISDSEISKILDLLKDLKGKEVYMKQSENGKELRIKFGRSRLDKNLYLNIPIKDNGTNLESTFRLLFSGHPFENCGFAYADPKRPFVKDGIKFNLQLSK